MESLRRPVQNKINRLAWRVQEDLLDNVPPRRGLGEETPSWTDHRRLDYERTQGYMLAHTFRLSTKPGQKFVVLIILVCHQKDSAGPPRRTFNEIRLVEFFFGSSWGNGVFRVKNTGGLLGVRTHAWGTFLATSLITFVDTKVEPIVLYRYVGFEMAPGDA